MARGVKKQTRVKTRDRKGNDMKMLQGLDKPMNDCLNKKPFTHTYT